MAFKGYKRSIQLSFNYDEVKKGVPDVNRAMAELGASYKKASEEIKLTGSTMDKLGLQHEKLSTQLKLQGDKVSILKDELEKLQQAEGNNEKAVQNKIIALKNAEAQYNRVQNELQETTKELDKQATKLGLTGDQWQKLSDKTKAVGTSLTTNVTLPILAAGAGAFKMASDMDEATSKAEVVFKENADVVKEWSKTLMDEFGLSSKTALTTAGDFGALAEGMGLNSAKALDLSMSLTGLSSDLASFHNTSTEMANTALKSIFTGETEALKRYGVVMTEVNLQQFAYSEGIRKKVRDMSEAEKVMLRYNFVMDKTALAQGDMARTGDSASNQMKKFKENLIQLGTSFGEFIVPMITPMLDFLNNLMTGFASLSDTTKKTITNVLMVAAVVGPVLLIISKIAEVINNVSGAMNLLNTVSSLFSGGSGKATLSTFAQWAGMITLVVAAVAALVIAINYLVGKGKEMNSAISDITGAMSTTHNQLNSTMQNASKRSYAIGTQFHPGGPAQINEYGSETVILPRGSKVLTAAESARDMQGNNSSSAGLEKMVGAMLARMDRIDESIKRLPDGIQSGIRRGAYN